MWVIFKGPEQLKGPGTRYIAGDGTVTESRLRAAKFYSFEDAREFAKERNIELTALTYIGRADFTEFEIERE